MKLILKAYIALSLAFSSSIFAAGEAESLLVRLMSGEAQTDGPWLVYEIKAKEGEIKHLSATGAGEHAVEHAKFRKDILVAKQAGNEAKLTLLVALTDLLEKGKALDVKALAAPTKLFMRSRVSEADARLGAVKVDQKYKDLSHQRNRRLYNNYAISEEEFNQSAERLKVANTLVTQAEEQAQLARKVYEEIVKEKP